MFPRAVNLNWEWSDLRLEPCFLSHHPRALGRKSHSYERMFKILILLPPDSVKRELFWLTGSIISSSTRASRLKEENCGSHCWLARRINDVKTPCPWMSNNSVLGWITLLWIDRDQKGGIRDHSGSSWQANEYCLRDRTLDKLSMSGIERFSYSELVVYRQCLSAYAD